MGIKGVWGYEFLCWVKKGVGLIILEGSLEDSNIQDMSSNVVSTLEAFFV